MPAKSQDKIKFIISAITIIIFLAGGFGAFFTLQSDVGHLEEDQVETKGKIEEHTKDINQLRIEDTRQSQILDNIDRSLSEIKEQTSKIPKLQTDLEQIKREL